MLRLWGKQPSKKPFSCPSLGSSFQRGTLFMKGRRSLVTWAQPSWKQTRRGAPRPPARSPPLGAAALAVGAPARPTAERHPDAGAASWWWWWGRLARGRSLGDPEQRVRPFIRHLSAHPSPVRASRLLSSPPVSCDLPTVQPGRQQWLQWKVLSVHWLPVVFSPVPCAQEVPRCGSLSVSSPSYRPCL